MIGPFTSFLLVLTLVSAAPEEQPKTSILAVFAHPDDEASVGPLLARYASEEHSVSLVTVTSGQLGVTAHAGIPAGEELARVREEEARCAASKLGIHPPILLGFQDQGISTPEAMAEIAGRLREIIEETRPSVLITWGPDGVTGHPDHRAVSNVVTQVFQQREMLQHRPDRLYYVSYPEDRLKGAAGQLGGLGSLHLVSGEFITTAVDCSGYMEQALEAMKCHKSQWTEEFIESANEMATRALENRVYLRQALPAPERDARQTSILD